MKRRELLCHKCMKKFTTNSKKRFFCTACQPPKDKQKQIQKQHGRFQPKLGDMCKLNRVVTALEWPRNDQKTKDSNKYTLQGDRRVPAILVAFKAIRKEFKAIRKETYELERRIT
jgi:hypothetical protein